ncbi:hypothetical protein [Nocardia pneumoniae]|uniref:hypothetical protein n=1 Tax=Nocardia pneumoniae TaxID=228601 RepID=UPI000309AE04|nr:hypothetical protein [Nocardia pneumoniae]
MIEYRGADWRRRHDAAPGRYPLGAEIPVRISYRTNRAYPLTRSTLVRTGLRGAALGAGLGLFNAVLLCVLLLM